MPVTYIDHLISRAHGHWRSYETLPLGLFFDMEREGLNVPELERQFYITEGN